MCANGGVTPSQAASRLGLPPPTVLVGGGAARPGAGHGGVGGPEGRGGGPAGVCERGGGEVGRWGVAVSSASRQWPAARWRRWRCAVEGRDRQSPALRQFHSSRSPPNFMAANSACGVEGVAGLLLSAAMKSSNNFMASNSACGGKSPDFASGIDCGFDGVAGLSFLGGGSG